MVQNLVIEVIEEYNLSSSYQKKIASLLQEAFPTYPAGKYYFNQLPSFRYLIWNDKKLIAHMGIEHRIIRLGDEIFRIFGLVDLCVAKGFQSQKIASSFLKRIEKQAKECHIDFLLLATEGFDLYIKHGFKLVENTSKWLVIRKSESLGVLHRKLEDCLLYKPVNDKKWKDGTLDFLGTLF